MRQLGNAVEKGLTPDERIALMGNEWALMRIGRHNVGDYLALGDQLKSTPGSVLLESFAKHLNFIREYLVTDADRPAFQAWLRGAFSPALQQLGYSARPDDSPEQRQKRAILFEGLGNDANDLEVIQQARTLVLQYMKDPASIDPTLAGAVVSVAAHHGDTELYNQFKAQMQKVKSPQAVLPVFLRLGGLPPAGADSADS